jgi:CSLREA domain-containing protein
MVRKAFLILVLLAATAGPLPGFASPQGTTIHVTTTEDEILNDGNCSLREAVLAADTDSAVDACPAGSGEDVIVLPAGHYWVNLEGAGEDAGLTGDLDITSSITLRGAGSWQTSIDASKDDRIFDIHPGSHTVRLEDLTLLNGGLGGYPTDDPVQGAGIRSQANLELVRVQILSTHHWDFEHTVEGVGIYNSGSLRLEYSEIAGGSASGAEGGGIYNTGTLTIVSSSINGFYGAYGGRGGGIYNSGSLTISSSLITNNYLATGHGPGIYNTGEAHITDSGLNWNTQDIYDNIEGGNIYNTGSFTCESCSILGGIGNVGTVIFNSGSLSLVDTEVGEGITRYGYGASIYSSGSLSLLRSKVRESNIRGILGTGELSLVDSEIYNNRSTTWAGYPDYGGGGLNFSGRAFIAGTYFHNNTSVKSGGAILGSGEWTIRDSTFRANTVFRESPDWDVDFEMGMGGAIYWNGGVLTITNSTFSGNQASDGGAGILVQEGEVRLDSVTLTLNESLDLAGSGGLALVNGRAVLHNSIIAANIEWYVPDCLQFSTNPLNREPASSEVISQGYNLIGVLNGCQITPGPGDQWGANVMDFLDPLLAPLADNGGPTLTHALLPGSPALDAGDPASCPLTDQRGVLRPQGPRCDTGAFELEQPGYARQVQIDIRPGNDHNPINPNSRATVPVAILSTPGFHAPDQVNPASLTFGRTGVEDSLDWNAREQRPNCQLRDANRDRQLDLVCLFKVGDMGFLPGDTLGQLRGSTRSGQPIYGADSVHILHPTERTQDEADTLLDQNAYMGEAYLYFALIHKK